MRRAALNVAEVVGPGDLVLYQGARPPSGSEASPSSTALLRKFSPRLLPGSWSATEQTKAQVVSRLLGEPFTVDSAQRQRSRGRGLVRMLEWLEGQPGETWQDRWIAGEAEAEGNVAWRRLPAQWLTCAGYAVGDSDQSQLTLARAMSLLVSGDVIRPSVGWLLTPATPAGW